MWNERPCVWEIVSVQNMTISPCLAASHYPAGMIYDWESLTLTTSSEQNLQRHHSQYAIFTAHTHTHMHTNAHKRTHTPYCCLGRYFSTLDLKMTGLKCRMSALILEYVHLYWVNHAGMMKSFHIRCLTSGCPEVIDYWLLGCFFTCWVSSAHQQIWWYGSL